MKTLNFLAIILLIIWTSSVNAQRIKGGAGFFNIGVANAFNAAAVLNKIAPTGVSGFSNQFYLIGGEGYYRTGKLILGLGGITGAQTVRSSGNSYGEGFIFNGHAKVGWIVNQGVHHWVYPTLGLGSSTLGMTTYIKSGNNTQDRLNRMIFRPSFDVGLNADFLLSKSGTTNQSFSGLLLGVRAGYTLSSKGNDWRADDRGSLPDLPTYQNEELYIMLTIGGGGFVKK